MEYYSAIKKNDTLPFAVDGPRDYHTKSGWERQISYDLTYMWNLKYDTCKTETDSQTEETNL